MATRAARQQSTVPSIAHSQSGGSTVLPAYEQCQFPLNPTAQRALALLLQNHSLKQLDHHLGEAQAAVSCGAGEINDRMTDAEKASKKRKERDEENDGGDDEDRSLEELRNKVTRMTERMEESMKKLIDGQHNVQSIKDSISSIAERAKVNASTQASSRSRTQRRRVGGDGDDEERGDEEYQDFEPTDPAAGTQAQTSAVEEFKKGLETAKGRYQSYTLTARYAENNAFRDFRRVVHDARHHDDGAELPHHSEWFPEGERPAPGVTTRRARADEEDADSDDDIAVSKATISTKCPLTLQEFKSPLTSTKCPHSFEGEVILQMVSQSRPQHLGGRKPEKAVQCPVSGCSKMLTKADLHTDNVLIRKIKRIQEAARLEEDESDEGEDGHGGTQNGATVIRDDEDGADVDDIVEGRTRVKGTQVKGEPKGTAGRRGTQSQSPRLSGVVDLGESSDEEAEEGEDAETEE